MRSRPVAMEQVPVRDYHINVFWSEEDDPWVADIPDLTYCSAVGKSPQEALAEMLIAKEAWLEAARAEGKPITSARYRPVIYEAAAG